MNRSSADCRAAALSAGSEEFFSGPLAYPQGDYRGKYRDVAQPQKSNVIIGLKKKSSFEHTHIHLR